MTDRTARAVATAIAYGATTASAEVEAALAAIAKRNPELGAFTDILADRARSRALFIDRMRTEGRRLPPLAGVPFAAKNLFDIAGLPTRAGSKINRTAPPATTDATAISRLEAAGAILVGATTMDEFAYGFTGENAHDGPARNPADLTRMTGGSSGGSAGAVAARLVPLALGSDTNGSIRVPASLCGLFGLKPTFGRLSRAGAFPFVASLDTVGPLARTVGDLAAAYDALQGADQRDPVCAPPDDIEILPEIRDGIGGLTIALAGGYFREGASEEAAAALEDFARAFGIDDQIDIPLAREARAAAFVTTAAEGGALHLPRLKTQAADYDPDTRDRLISGAMLPARWVVQASRFRRRFLREVMAVFDEVDVVIALSTPITAPLLGQKTFHSQGQELPVRPHLGLYTQPLSFAGLPVVSVPLKRPPGALPIGLQVIAAPWGELTALKVAREIERRGLAASPDET